MRATLESMIEAVEDRCEPLMALLLFSRHLLQKSRRRRKHRSEDSDPLDSEPLVLAKALLNFRTSKKFPPLHCYACVDSDTREMLIQKWADTIERKLKPDRLGVFANKDIWMPA